VAAYEKQPKPYWQSAPTPRRQRKRKRERDEVLRRSAVSPIKLLLANNPVLIGTLQLQVDQARFLRIGRRFGLFRGPAPNDHVYVLDRTLSARFATVPTAQSRSHNSLGE